MIGIPHNCAILSFSQRARPPVITMGTSVYNTRSLSRTMLRRQWRRQSTQPPPAWQRRRARCPVYRPLTIDKRTKNETVREGTNGKMQRFRHSRTVNRPPHVATVDTVVTIQHHKPTQRLIECSESKYAKRQSATDMEMDHWRKLTYYVQAPFRHTSDTYV
jgi:hypothetical protein